MWKYLINDFNHVYGKVIQGSPFDHGFELTGTAQSIAGTFG